MHNKLFTVLAFLLLSFGLAQGVTNRQLAPMPSETIKCNSSGSAARPSDCTPDQVNAFLKPGGCTPLSAYGAVPNDSSTGAKTANNAALAAAVAAAPSTGGCISWPNASFYFSAGLTITKQNLKFVGNHSASYRHTTQTPAIFVDCSSSCTFLNVDVGSSGTEFSGPWIQGLAFWDVQGALGSPTVTFIKTNNQSRLTLEQTAFIYGDKCIHINYPIVAGADSSWHNFSNNQYVYCNYGQYIENSAGGTSQSEEFTSNNHAAYIGPGVQNWRYEVVDGDGKNTALDGFDIRGQHNVFIGGKLEGFAAPFTIGTSTDPAGTAKRNGLLAVHITGNTGAGQGGIVVNSSAQETDLSRVVFENISGSTVADSGVDTQCDLLECYTKKFTGGSVQSRIGFELMPAGSIPGLGTTNRYYRLLTSDIGLWLQGSNSTLPGGLFLNSNHADRGRIGAGSYGQTYTGQDTAVSSVASWIRWASGDTEFYGDTGLTSGAAFTPTLRASISGTTGNLSLPTAGAGVTLKAPNSSTTASITLDNSTNVKIGADSLISTSSASITAAGTTTLTSTNIGEHVIANATAGAQTIVLPTGAASGDVVFVQKIDSSANRVTVQATSGTDSAWLSNQYDWIWFRSTGSGWFPYTWTITPLQNVYTSGSGTWSKPPLARTVTIFAIGGGGGGGSGRTSASGTAASGGTGGGCGAFVQLESLASTWNSTESYAVGAAGVGGAAVSASSTNGNVGTAGGNTTFSGTATRQVIARGGGVGAAAGTAAIAGGAGQIGSMFGANAGTTSITGAPAQSGYCSQAGSGGSGGGITTAGAAQVGGAPGGSNLMSLATLSTTATCTTAPAVVTLTPIGSGYLFPISTGGAGGGACATAAAGGGADGTYGGGGGGGGAALNTFTSGKGGNGGNGWLGVLTRFN